MAISETRSTTTGISPGNVTWIRLVGTSQEVMDQLTRADIVPRKVIHYSESGTTAIAVYCMAG